MVFLVKIHLPYFRQRDGFPDVPPLARLVATTKQDDQQAATLDKIDAKSGTVVYLQLGNALADIVHLTRIALLQPLQPSNDAA